MQSYILKTMSGRRLIVTADSEQAARKSFMTPREFTEPWTKKVISLPAGEMVEKIAPLGVMLSGDVDDSMLNK